MENATLLLHHGAAVEVDPSEIDPEWDASRETTALAPSPLHMAAREGHDEVAQLLLEHGSNPNTPDQVR